MTCRTCQETRRMIGTAWRKLTHQDSNLRAWRQLELRRKRERHLTLEEQRVMDTALRRSADDRKRSGNT
jgi:hypothetical protein